MSRSRLLDSERFMNALFSTDSVNGEDDREEVKQLEGPAVLSPHEARFALSHCTNIILGKGPGNERVWTAPHVPLAH